MTITAPQQTLWKRRLLLFSYVSILGVQGEDCNSMPLMQSYFSNDELSLSSWNLLCLTGKAKCVVVFVDGSGVPQKEQTLYRLPNSGPRNITTLDFGVTPCLLFIHVCTQRDRPSSTAKHKFLHLSGSALLCSFPLSSVSDPPASSFSAFFPSPEQLPKE